MGILTDDMKRIVREQRSGSDRRAGQRQDAFLLAEAVGWSRRMMPKELLRCPVGAYIRTCAQPKKVRVKSPRRYNSCVRQPVRHVMALRVSKAVLVFAIALFYTILVLNNITDYGSNYEFVRHVLMMDSTFPGNHGMWRAVNSPLVHTVFYIGIIAWESVTMLLCWWGGVRLLKSYRADRAQFAAVLNVAVIALTTSLLMWLVAFLDVGGEWFLMWQSQKWNGQEEAFRMFTIVGVVFLVVVQREPTPD
jgi:predicted small integral membrane protein